MTEAIPQEPRTFEQFVQTLRPLSSPETAVPAEREVAIRTAVTALETLPSIDREQLATLIQAHPDWVPVLGLVLGLSQEQLKNHLRYTTGSPGWLKLAHDNPARLIEVLDSDELKVVEQLDAQRKGAYTFADVLIARASSRERAGRAITRGRNLEDLVEEVIRRLGLKYEMRSRFVGRGGETAPCDFAIPAAHEKAQIVVAVKGFDSTGSKLTAAVDEVAQMAQKRRPGQFVYAVVDGIGWLGRQADLRRLFQQFANHEIDGLYTLATFGEFERDMRDAARRLGMILPA